MFWKLQEVYNNFEPEPEQMMDLLLLKPEQLEKHPLVILAGIRVAPKPPVNDGINNLK